MHILRVISLAALFLLAACDKESADDKFMSGQGEAASSGTLSVNQSQREQFIDSLRAISKTYGLREMRDRSLENLVLRNENREAYHAYFCKGDVCGLVVGDLPSQNEFMYLTFSEPFEAGGYSHYNAQLVATFANYDTRPASRAP